MKRWMRTNARVLRDQDAANWTIGSAMETSTFFRRWMNSGKVQLVTLWPNWRHLLESKTDQIEATVHP